MHLPDAFVQSDLQEDDKQSSYTEELLEGDC